MRLQKIKLRTGTLESFLMLSSEFLEDLLHFRPSKAIERLLALKEKRLRLAETELEAPGREISYLIMLNEKLTGKKS